jgi:hypothetical protein
MSSKEYICPVNLSSFLSSKNLLLVLGLQGELICILLAWHILLTLVAFVYPNQIANPSLNTVLITLVNQIKISFLLKTQ